MSGAQKYSDLKVGLVLIVTAAIVIVAIMKMDEQRGLFGDEYELMAHFARINGLTVGAPVWLAGVDVGSVTAVDFVDSEDEKKIRIKLSIKTAVADRIRANSVATIESQGLLGSKLISVTIGDLNERRLEDGDEIFGRPPDDLTQILAEAGGAVDDVSYAIKDIRKVVSGIEEGRGTVGRLIRDDLLYRRVVDMVGVTQGMILHVDELMEQIVKGDGTTGKLFSTSDIHDKVDGIIDGVQDGKGTVGLALKDDRVYEDVVKMIAKVDLLLAGLEDGQGSAGKVLRDDEAYIRLIRVLSEAERLLVDIRENPDRYLKVEVF